QDRAGGGSAPSRAPRLLHPARWHDLRRGTLGGDASRGLSTLAPPPDDHAASTAAATAGHPGQGSDRVASLLPLRSPPLDWSVPSPARHSVPAHHGAAEHAWKDGDSGRRGQRHAAIVDMLTHDGLGHSEDGGGAFATRDAVLCAIMEDATGEWLVGGKGEYPINRPYLPKQIGATKGPFSRRLTEHPPISDMDMRRAFT